MYKKELKPTLKSATQLLTAGDIDNAERFWILESQSSMAMEKISYQVNSSGSALANEMTEFTLLGDVLEDGWKWVITKARSFYYHMSRDFHVYMPSTYIVEVIWECYQLVLRRFVSIRGYPSKMYSDNGSQLVAASDELNKMVKNLDQKSLQEYGCIEGFQWVFSSADAPWQNGVSEGFIKSMK